MPSYVFPTLIAVACAAGVTLAARHALRSRAECREAGIREADITDTEFMTAHFDGSAPDIAPAVVREVVAEVAPDIAHEVHEVREVPAPHIPRQDPAMAGLVTPLRSTTPHPSQGLPPMLPAHLTGAHLLGVAARGTAVTGLRSGTAGGLDVFDFADGGSIVVMPSDPEVAELVDAALEQGQDVCLLGTSEVGGGRSMTFRVHDSTAFVLADRVYARPAA